MAEEPDLAIMRIPRAGMFILAVFSGNDQKVCYQAQKMHAYITFIVITFALDKILYFCLLKQIDISKLLIFDDYFLNSSRIHSLI